jgi:hypothetical protein
MTGPDIIASSHGIELSIVYVNWNSLDYLRESISSVLKYTHDTVIEIIVVDNASPEAGLESLEQLFPNVLLLRSEKNLGFARANNYGFRHSVGSYLLFLNPDTRLIEPSIGILLAYYRSLPDAGIVGCKLLNTDGSIQLSSIDTFPTILNQAFDSEFLRCRWPACPLWEISPLFSTGEALAKVDIISGACMLVSRRVFEEVGLFSEEYFMYAEDLDLNYKVKSAGFVNYYVGKTSIIHHGSKSSVNQDITHWSVIMKYRSMMQLFRKTKGNTYAQGYRIAMGIVAAGRLLLLILLWPLGRMLPGSVRNLSSIRKWKTIMNLAAGWKAETVERG